MTHELRDAGEGGVGCACATGSLSSLPSSASSFLKKRSYRVIIFLNLDPFYSAYVLRGQSESAQGVM